MGCDTEPAWRAHKCYSTARAPPVGGGEQRARHDPNPRGCNAVHPEDLSEDVMKWLEGLLVDPEEAAPAPTQAGYQGGGGFADGSSGKMDLNLNLKKAWALVAVALF